MDRYKNVVLRDVYAKWHMHRDWRQAWVKDAFVELRELIAMKLALAPSGAVLPCHALDREMVDILEKHAKGDRALYQSIFVALVLDALKTKANDAFGVRMSHLVTYGYRAPLLAFLVARILEENVDNVMKLHENARARDEIFSFFDL
jgi:hypothetical protein